MASQGPARRCRLRRPGALPGRAIDAQILNLSAEGFRIHSAKPIEVGSEVTLEVAKEFPVKALICWSCGLEAGGVFSEPVTL